MFEELGMLPIPSALDLAEFKREIGALYMLKEQAFAAGDPDLIVTRFYAETLPLSVPGASSSRGAMRFARCMSTW